MQYTPSRLVFKQQPISAAYCLINSPDDASQERIYSGMGKVPEDVRKGLRRLLGLYEGGLSLNGRLIYQISTLPTCECISYEAPLPTSAVRVRKDKNVVKIQHIASA